MVTVRIGMSDRPKYVCVSVTLTSPMDGEVLISNCYFAQWSVRESQYRLEISSFLLIYFSETSPNAIQLSSTQLNFGKIDLYTMRVCLLYSTIRVWASLNFVVLGLLTERTGGGCLFGLGSLGVDVCNQTHLSLDGEMNRFYLLLYSTTFIKKKLEIGLPFLPLHLSHLRSY